jgi:zinc-ribbon domain
MSEPEIARRCSACGLSVRERAMFCPQCGNQIGDQNVTEALQQPEVAATQPLSAVIPPPPAPAPNPLVRKVPEDGVRGRVEKIRRVSSVMIDQAAYDPSLRFLLVAAALFLFFLVLLILSKVLG